MEETQNSTSQRDARAGVATRVLHCLSRLGFHLLKNFLLRQNFDCIASEMLVMSIARSLLLRSGSWACKLSRSSPWREGPCVPVICYPSASLAQVVEHALRKHMVVGSIPTGGSLLACCPVTGLPVCLTPGHRSNRQAIAGGVASQVAVLASHLLP